MTKKKESKDLSFDEALNELQKIVKQVRRKDLSLEKSLDLLEEGIELANVCTEKIDHTLWRERSEGSEGAPLSDQDRS